MKIDEFLDKFKFKFNILRYCLIIFHIFYYTNAITHILLTMIITLNHLSFLCFWC